MANILAVTMLKMVVEEGQFNASTGNSFGAYLSVCNREKQMSHWLGFWYTDDRAFLAKNVNSLPFKMNNNKKICVELDEKV